VSTLDQAGPSAGGVAAGAPDSGTRFWGPARDVAALEAVPTVRVLREEHREAVLAVSDFRGDLSITVRPDDLLLVAQTLKIHPELAYDMLMDVCGLDRLLTAETPRFHAVYHLYSTTQKQRVRLHVPLDDAKPAVDSLTPLYKSALWAEREAWDMYGIEFVNHPDLRRILTHEEFEGFPLRKDYPADRRHALSRTYSAFPGLPAEQEGRTVVEKRLGECRLPSIKITPRHALVGLPLRVDTRQLR